MIAAVLMLLVVGSLAPLVSMAALPPGATGTVAAVFPPGRSDQALRAVVAADGRLVRQGAFGWVLVVHGTEPGLAGRLQDAGAWLVLDPEVARGCLLL